MEQLVQEFSCELIMAKASKSYIDLFFDHAEAHGINDLICARDDGFLITTAYCHCGHNFISRRKAYVNGG